MDGRGRLAALLAGTAGIGALAAPAAAEAHAYRFHADHVLGTSLDILAVAPDPTSALMAAEAARGEIARLDGVLSGWRPDSELSALNGADRAQVSPDLFRVLAACEQWRAATGGAFDARQGQALALRREAVLEGGPPDPAELRRLTDAAGAAEVRLDPSTRMVERPQGVRFAPEALAKGYVVDAALAAGRAASPALAGLMIDIGGDLRCWGRGPDAGGWTIGVADPAAPEDNAAPAALLDAAGRAVATSGPSRRDLVLADETYPHILGASGAQATVVAATAADADALATVLAVLAPTDGIALADRLDGVEARVVEASGAVHESAGWSRIALQPPSPASRGLPPGGEGHDPSSSPVGGGGPREAGWRGLKGADARLVRVAAAAAAPWPARFALTIDYELPRHTEVRAYPPYLAIWITDQDNRLVRGLTMLGDNLDYVSENYIWWRRYGRSRPQVVASISRPTRRPGRYSAVWDGKDDMGQAVGQGRYTVHIEAVREDGGHSYQSMPMMLGAAPAQAGAAAEDELGATVVRYGRR